jgi:small subunit ribosomal protein S20
LANTKSALKMIRVAAKKRARNMPVRSALKTYVGKARKQIVGGQLELAEPSVREAISALDRAAERGVIHRNQAARRKSRLMKQLNKAQPSA